MTREPLSHAFIISGDEGAHDAEVIAAGRAGVIPWQMAAVSVLWRLLPRWLYDRVVARAPRKPKDLPI